MKESSGGRIVAWKSEFPRSADLEIVQDLMEQKVATRKDRLQERTDIARQDIIQYGIQQQETNWNHT